MLRKTIILFAISSCAWSSLAVAAAGKGAAETATVVAVEVPVQVLLDGKAVRGLTADNFELVDGRKTQTLTGFEVVDLQPGKVPTGQVAKAPPPAGRRYFLVLIDMTFSEPPAILKARRAVADLVRTGLHPSDMVAIATYKNGPGPQLLLNFTTDRRQVELALSTLGAPQLLDRHPDILGVVVGDVASLSNVHVNVSDAASAKDAVVLEYLKEMRSAETKVERQDLKIQVQALTKGLTDLGRLMNSVVGRKYVVYLSQGFDSSLLTGSTSLDDAREANSSIEHGEIWKVDNDARYGHSEVQNELERMIESFRRADCQIEAIDIGGLAVQADQRARASGREALFAMAKGTGGQLVENFNNVGEALNEVLQMTSVTYVLTFQPEDLKLDGKYHPIKVRLKGGPSGARLAHRPGYYAPVPYGARRGVDRQLDTAQRLLTGEAGGPMKIGAALVPFRGDATRAYVPIVVEVAGADLIAGAAKEANSLDVFVYALDDAGTIRDYIVQSLHLEMDKVGERLKQGNLRIAGSLFLPPGSYNVRLLVRRSPSGDYSLRSLPLTVPDFNAPGLMAAPPVVAAEMTTGLVVRASTQNRPKEPIFPFIAGRDHFYLPSVLTQLASNTETRLYWMTYGLAPGDVKVEGRVIGPDGKEVSAAPVKFIDRAVFDQPGLERLTLEVKSPQLPAGQYQLLLSLTDAKGAMTTGALSFSVGS